MPSQLVGLFKKLTWNDFQGTPPGGPFAAATASSFKVSQPTFTAGGGGFLLDDNLTVTVVFDAKKSWKIADIATWPQTLQGFLLDHEQGHYDITAVMARDLFIQLMKKKDHAYLSAVDGRKDIQWYIDLYQDNKNKVQTAYDSDTGHSQANVFVPSTSYFTPPPQKGGPQSKWEGLIASAFTRLRVPSESAPDNTPYKIELMEVLRQAQITP